MAAKEPTVERRHRVLAAHSVQGTWPVGKATDKWIQTGATRRLVDFTLSNVAFALAAAEQAAAERAWDEGYARGALAMPDPVNPYRKGDE